MQEFPRDIYFQAEAGLFVGKRREWTRIDRNCGMTFIEALEFAKRGFSVRRPGWNDESKLTKDGVYVGNKLDSCDISRADMAANDWTLHTSVSNADLNRRSQDIR